MHLAPKLLYSTWTYKDVAEVFLKSSETDDLVRLLDIAPRFAFQTAVPATVRSIVEYLSKQSSEDLRTRALDVIEKALKRAKAMV